MNNEISLAKIDCESSIDRAARDFEFAYALMQQNKEMEDFVNESLILASGNKYAINEMVIIHEAAAGDKIKAFFEKIKNFFKKIFDKLGATMNALFQEQKKYIEQYQYIITKCKWQCGDVADIYDHFKGLPRIVDCIDKGETAILGTNMDKYLKGDTPPEDKDLFLNVDTFKSAQEVTNKLNDMKQHPLDLEKEKATMFDAFINGSYWKSIQDFQTQNDANGNKSISETFKAWFDGSADTVTYSGEDIESNFQTVINACYAGQSYMNKLESIVTTVTKKMDAASKTMETYFKDQKEKIMAAVKNIKPTEENNPGGNNPGGNPPGDNNPGGNPSGDNNPGGNPSGDNNPGDNPPKVIKVKITDAGNNHFTAQFPNDSSLDQGLRGKLFYNSSGESKEAFESRMKEKAPTGYTIQLESYRYNYRNYFNEDITIGANNSTNKSNTGTNLTGSASDAVNRAGETNTKISNAQTNKMTAKNVDGAATGIEKEAEELLNLDITNRQTKINAEVNISTSIATAAFNSFKLTNKDFFSIIKAHVQWYLSNPGAEKATENQTTRPRVTEMTIPGKNPVTQKAPGGNNTTGGGNNTTG